MPRISNHKLYGAIKDSQTAQENAMKELEEAISRPKKSLDEFNDNITNLNNILNSMIDSRNQEKLTRAEEERANAIKNDSANISKAFKQLGKRVIELAKVMADTANKYSQISNELITVSGATGRDVRSTRTEIVQGIIHQINSETGYLLNPEQSYKKIVDIANQANIGNLEAIEAITRPMLIASETMNLQNGELASLFNKWYTRYNFSSAQMEDMVDEIRGNTAGNNATAQATLENISKFQNFIGVYADSTEEMQNMVAAISQESSRLESVGINSGYIFDYMKQIGQGDFTNATTIMSLLNNSGTGLDWSEAQRLLRSGNAGDMKLVSESLSQGALAIGEKLKDSSVTAEGLKAYGLDVEEIYNILSASGVIMNPEEFQDSVSGTQTAIESMDDKFVTWSDKIHNTINGISERLANIQESWGWGLGPGISDIIQTLVLIYSAIQLNNLVGGSGRSDGNIRRKLQSAPGGSGISAASLGKVAGTAANIGGIAAGVGLAAYGTVNAVDSYKNEDYGVAAGYGTAASLGGIGAAGIGLGMIGSAAGYGALAAAGPVGWVALAVGAIALAATIAVKNSKNSGTEELLRAAYEEEKNRVLDVISDQESALREIKGSLAMGADAAEVAQNLVNTGILTEEDRQRALLAGQQGNIEALQELTEAYLGAKKQFSEEFENTFDRISNDAELAGGEYQKRLEMMLQTINDEGAFNSTQLEELYSVFLAIKKDLESQGELRGADKNIYDSIVKALEDGVLTDREANSVIDEGWNNKDFQNAHITVEAWRKIQNLLAGSDDETFSSWANSRRLHSTVEGMLTESEVTALVNEELERQGIDTENQGVPQADGTNYVPFDGFKASLHEGETVVPKKYNPAANVTELEMLRNYYKNSMNRESEINNATMEEMRNVLVEIKDFLNYWRNDNIQRGITNKLMNKVNPNSNYITRYMNS